MRSRPRLPGLVGVLLAVAALVAGVAVGVSLVAPSAQAPSPVAGDSVPDPAPDPVVRLAVAGDTGTGSPDQHRTVEQMVEQVRSTTPYDALVLLGDLVYDDGDAALVEDRVLEPFSPVTARGAVLVPALGNHDYQSGEQQQILAALGRDRSWYVQHVGPVRVVVLDSERVGHQQQRQWLADVLARPRGPGQWTVVAMHRPAYSAGQHGSDPDIQRAWVPLFGQHDVSLVLAGHDHDYQRSRPIDGVTYVVSGAGAKLRDTGRGDFTAVSASTHHFLDLLAYEDRLVGRAIDHDGTLVDAFTLRR